MKRVLLTGGTGFIGRNVIPILTEKCELLAPTRGELNLYSEEAVRDYIRENRINIVIHAANPNPVKNSIDKAETMFENSIRLFMNLYRSSDLYEMMYTIGSGAEYDKSKDIINVSEEDEERSIPYDPYGLTKYTINQIIKHDNKQCNLRIFGCYGPTDHISKFLTHAINCCLDNKDITIRQDCYFDYMHVYDLANILEYFILHTPQHRSYNVCSGKRILLSEIAYKVIEQMQSSSNVVVLKDGLNKEYTASNNRLLDEIGNYEFITMDEGIRIQIEYEKKARKENEKKSC